MKEGMSRGSVGTMSRGGLSMTISAPRAAETFSTRTAPLRLGAFKPASVNAEVAVGLKSLAPMPAFRRASSTPEAPKVSLIKAKKTEFAQPFRRTQEVVSPFQVVDVPKVSLRRAVPKRSAFSLSPSEVAPIKAGRLDKDAAIRPQLQQTYQNKVDQVSQVTRELRAMAARGNVDALAAKRSTEQFSTVKPTVAPEAAKKPESSFINSMSEVRPMLKKEKDMQEKIRLYFEQTGTIAGTMARMQTEGLVAVSMEMIARTLLLPEAKTEQSVTVLSESKPKTEVKSKVLESSAQALLVKKEQKKKEEAKKEDAKEKNKALVLAKEVRAARAFAIAWGTTKTLLRKLINPLQATNEKITVSGREIAEAFANPHPDHISGLAKELHIVDGSLIELKEKIATQVGALDSRSAMAQAQQINAQIKPIDIVDEKRRSDEIGVFDIALVLGTKKDVTLAA